MADLTQTAASVAFVSGSIVGDFTAGATITEGKPVYLDSNNVWQLMRATTATLAGNGTRTGIALTPATSGRRIFVQETGIVNLGATLTVGKLYCVSAALGAICPYEDLATTNKVTILGIAETAANLNMAYKQAFTGGYSGVAIP